MILVDALYVNSGGGKILLDYLVSNILERDMDITFILDERLKDILKSYKFKNKPKYIKATLWNRFYFYYINKSKISLVFCFANIPPPIKLNAITYTYFHNVLYINKVDNLFTLAGAKRFLKNLYFKQSLRNSDYWIVQTDLIKIRFVNFTKVNQNFVLTIPFYKPIKFEIGKKYSLPESPIKYIYVSSGEHYKNHMNLFYAFEKFNILYSNVVLYVTIGFENLNLINYIKLLNYKGIKIVNLGNISFSDLISYYAECNYCIFPSLYESFGLGLIEAAQFNIPILASDLDYVHEIVRPSLTFDPKDHNSILSVLKVSMEYKVEPSKLLVQDRIIQIMDLLKFNINE